MVNATQGSVYHNDLMRMQDLTKAISLKNQKSNCWRNSYTLHGTNVSNTSSINANAKGASFPMHSHVYLDT